MPDPNTTVHRISLDGAGWWIQSRLPNEWIWAKAQDLEPGGPGWRPATVPGSVQDDLLDQGVIPDPYYELQSRACEWTWDRDWIYARVLEVPEELRQGSPARWTLVFHGVDYHAHVHLNGQKLAEHEGAFIPFEVDVTEQLRADAPNRLTVVVDRAPDEQWQIGWTSRVRTWKPRFAYGWDWCTRLVPLGLWGSVELVRDTGLRITGLWARPVMSDDLGSAQVTVEVAYSASRAASGAARVVIRGGEGIVTEATLPFEAQPGEHTVTATLSVDHPQLWWPNGHGDQPLYTVCAWIQIPGAADERSTRIGFRRVRMITNDSAPAGALPYVIEVNGRRIFIKGWNWAPIHHLYRRQSPEKYHRWLELVKEAHVTLLRVWGGGLLERELFYDLCDEAGIMVWQSFCQSSSGIDNEPPRDSDYLNMAVRHAEAMIPQRRNHASLVLWCGGNELMHADWTPLDSKHPALAVLKDCVERLDPDRVYLPTSASGPSANASLERLGKMHDVHGPWTYGGLYDHYRLYNGMDALLHSEFGVEGAARLRAYPRFVSAERVWPPDATNEIWTHHGAWWINADRLGAMFGTLHDLPTHVRASQFIQAEGLRYAIEANRRRKWRCSGTSPWQYNESWPNASCTNSLDWLGQPRPAYFWVRKAYEPLHASARYDTIARHEQRRVACTLFVSNSLADAAPVELVARLHGMDGALLSERVLRVTAEPCACTQGGEFEWEPDPSFADVALLRLTLRTRDGLETTPNEYLFTWAPAPELSPLLSLPATRVELTPTGQGITLHNGGGAVALLVWVEPEDDAEWPVFGDNYVCLLPGETRDIAVRQAPAAYVVDGLNLVKG
ncbi:MAG TPA: glycoside hydrolase family 2 TIM barrel-domain containing protein [Armatimonadota bacterium]|nr:glycoside hydrolase family 2 TIM barrel-domain containing protein [Armatimonadota bacterium]HQK94019.1 glycoside hydrolase family 2 TIM barrel-domain containing protein [Armatimonadota bacterium]